MDFVQTILSAAKAVKISGTILVAICSHESDLKNIIVPFDGGSPTYGICQVKLDTARMFGYSGDDEGLMDPKTNAKYAAKYLKYQYKRYGNWCQAVSAYNAGRYNESRKKPGYPRNLKYVLKVSEKLNNDFHETISCDNIPTGESKNVTENYGIGRGVQSAKP
jgi:soluble lytic murein transglycosylase-like protein